MKIKRKISSSKNSEQFVRRAIADFVRKDPANRIKTGRGKYMDAPVVGFASGDDPLFKQYKQIIGRFHLTPREMFNQTLSKNRSAEEISVISWVLPISEAVRRSNRNERKYPSLLWSHARWFGEKFNVKLRDHIVSLLRKKGYSAVAPMNSPRFRRVESPRVGRASNWSERHVAYACGLGTFGLCDGLITARGKALRLGSIITDLPLKPSAKLYPDRHANCLYYFDKSCRECAARCPAGAITSKGHDKKKCSEYTRTVISPAKKAEYGVGITGCGLCQVKVPCEFEIPKRIQKARA